MGYYMRGDYYRRGDFWSTLGNIGKSVIGGTVGFATGGIGPGLKGALAPFAAKPQAAAPTNPGPSFTVPTFKGLNPIGGPPKTFGPLTLGPGGHHRPKKGEPGWKPRRMHVTNPKALRRAIRRAQGFEKLAMKVLSFTRPHGRPKGHPHFKRKRR